MVNRTTLATSVLKRKGKEKMQRYIETLIVHKKGCYTAQINVKGLKKSLYDCEKKVDFRKTCKEIFGLDLIVVHCNNFF